MSQKLFRGTAYIICMYPAPFYWNHIRCCTKLSRSARTVASLRQPPVTKYFLDIPTASVVTWGGKKQTKKAEELVCHHFSSWQDQNNDNSLAHTSSSWIKELLLHVQPAKRRGRHRFCVWTIWLTRSHSNWLTWNQSRGSAFCSLFMSMLAKCVLARNIYTLWWEAYHYMYTDKYSSCLFGLL